MTRSILLALLVTVNIQAQEPPRPRLAASADTNSAADYIAWGSAKLRSAPDSAAAAFYWAARIDPASGDAFYSRWVAMQLADPGRAWNHLRRDKSVLQSADVQRIDSIELRALELGPLGYRTLDANLVAIAASHQAPQTATTREPLAITGAAPPPGMEGFARNPAAAGGGPPPPAPKADLALLACAD